MVKHTKFYIDNVVLGTIALVLATAMVFSISLPVQAEPATTSRGGCDIGGSEPDDVFVIGEGHRTVNDNNENVTCHGQAENPPTSGGARVVETEPVENFRCHGVATPSGNGNIVCNVKE